jgi:hypothetical protein
VYEVAVWAAMFRSNATSTLSKSARRVFIRKTADPVESVERGPGEPSSILPV